MIRILIIEDHDMVREGFCHFLSTVNNMTVVGEASTGQTGVTLAKKVNPDVILLDVNLPDSTGLDVTDKLRRYYT